MFGPCRGCLAKDAEIDRLSKREAALLDRLLSKSGEAPLAADLLAAAEAHEHPQFCPACGLESGRAMVIDCKHAWHEDEAAIVLTTEQQDQEAERRLAKLAEAKGVDIAEYADA